MVQPPARDPHHSAMCLRRAEALLMEAGHTSAGIRIFVCPCGVLGSMRPCTVCGLRKRFSYALSPRLWRPTPKHMSASKVLSHVNRSSGVSAFNYWEKWTEYTRSDNILLSSRKLKPYWNWSMFPESNPPPVQRRFEGGYGADPYSSPLEILKTCAVFDWGAIKVINVVVGLDSSGVVRMLSRQSLVPEFVHHHNSGGLRLFGRKHAQVRMLIVWRSFPLWKVPSSFQSLCLFSSHFPKC